MGIVVGVLLNLEHLVLCLQVHTDRDIQGLVLIGQRVVVGILHITACKLVPLVLVNIVLDEFFVEVLQHKILTLQVDHRALGTLLVNQHNGADAGLLGYEGIVSTEVGSDMHDTGTVFSGHIVTGNHPEGITHGLDGRHQLFILNTNEVATLITGYDAVRNQFLTLLVFGHLTTVGDTALGRQIGIQTSLGQHQRHLLGSIGIVGLHGHIVNLRTYAEG